MASYRHQARIAVMQTIFAYEVHNNLEPEETLKFCIQEFFYRMKDISFAKDLLKGVLKNKDSVYKVIEEEAPEWPVDRIAPVDRAILAIGVYEIIYCQDVPPVVAINEGVEIAKEYGDVNSPKFINGVLSSVMNKYRPKKVSPKKEETQS